MTKRDSLATLSQIAEHARHAQELCASQTPAELEADWKSSLALERALEILGEAVKRLPAELCAAYPAVPWRLVAGMRDRLSHGYDDVDHEILWNAVHQDLPNLLKTVEQMMQDLTAGGPRG
ncbi:MAG TPA: HepT-like ribonuclease domain-containing protein [Pyrinomonadaceae bacterium]|nr:HepT-like ribonuclease domain-containing protein [Pyrinomonadaceae bacterium]